MSVFDFRQSNCSLSSLTVLVSSSSLRCPTYVLWYTTYFSSSSCSLSSALVVGGRINESVTSTSSSFGSVCLIFSLLKAISLISIFWSMSVWGFGVLYSINELVSSFVLALVLSQSSLDQSHSWGEGCRAPCSQKGHDRPNLSHA